MTDHVPTQDESEGARTPALFPLTSSTIDSSPLPELLPPTCGADLKTLSEAINDAHQTVQRHGHSMVEAALRAGEALLQSKVAVEHGDFKDWVEANCQCSYRSARRYMQVAKLAREKMANCGHFDESISAFLTKHGKQPRTVCRTEPCIDESDTAPVVEVQAGNMEAGVDVCDTSLETTIVEYVPSAPTRPTPIPPFEFTTAASFERALTDAAGVGSVKLDLVDPEIFKRREAVVDQLSYFDRNDLLMIIAETLMKVEFSNCSTS